jgi:hypothetical protein
VVPIPYIAELHPSIRLPGGNVTLRGKGFYRHMLCHAQGIGVLTSQYINASAVQCKLPGEKYPDEVALSLVLDNDRPVSNELYFTIVDFRVISMNPSFGGINGGTPVTSILDPKSVSAVTHCKFGKTIVSATIIHNQLVCESPPAVDPGVVCVELGVNARNFLDSGHSFEYTLGPEISSIQPSFGSETGGKAVRLSGSFANCSHISLFLWRRQCSWEVGIQ